MIQDSKNEQITDAQIIEEARKIASKAPAEDKKIICEMLQITEERLIELAVISSRDYLMPVLQEKIDSEGALIKAIADDSRLSEREKVHVAVKVSGHIWRRLAMKTETNIARTIFGELIETIQKEM